MTKFSRITQLVGAHLTQFQEIYESSFEEYERDPLEDVIQDVASEKMILLAALENEQIVGFAAFYTLEISNEMYLPYLALSPKMRGQGLGSQFFNFMIDYLSKNTPSKRLLWEVKTPASDDETLIENRRVRFYEKLGSRRVMFAPNYRIPYLENTYSYYLYWISLKETVDSITHADVISWVKDIYAIYYPESTALMATIIAEIEGNSIT